MYIVHFIRRKKREGIFFVGSKENNMKAKIYVLWDIILCSSMSSSRRFGLS
jgi:hypothetical protein